MADRSEDLKVKLSAEGLEQVLAAFRKIQDEEKKLAVQAREAAEAAKARARAEDDLANAAKRRAEAIQKAGSGIAGFGATMTAAVTVPMVGLVKESIEAYARIDALKRGLEAVMGSAKGAGDEFKRLQPVAKLPGIGLEEAVQGSVNLQAIGFSADKARNVLLQFGNALGTVGRGKEDLAEVVRQLGQLQGRGKVTADNLKPILERVPQVAKILKDFYGTVDSEQISKMLAKQGKGSTEFINMLLVELEKLPRFTKSVKNDLETTGDEINQTFAGIGQSMEASISAGLGLFNDMLGVVRGLTEQFNKLSPPVKSAAVALAASLAVIGPLALGVGGLVMAIGAMSSALAAWGLSFAAVAAPIAAAAVAIAGLGYVLLEYKRQSADPTLASTSALVQIFDELAESWKTVQRAFSSEGSSGGGFMDKLIYGAKVFVALLVGGVQQLATIMREVWDQFRAFQAGVDAMRAAGYNPYRGMFTEGGRKVFSEARDKYLKENSVWDENNAATTELMAKILADAPPDVVAPVKKKKDDDKKNPPFGTTDAKKVKDWTDEIIRARKAAALAQIEAEKILQEQLYKLGEDEAKRQYELGQMSVDEYYRGRREALAKKQAEEQNALSGRYGAILGVQGVSLSGDELLAAAQGSKASLESQLTGETKGAAGEANYKRLQQIAELSKLIGEIEKQRVVHQQEINAGLREEANEKYRIAAEEMKRSLDLVRQAQQEQEKKYEAGTQDRYTTDRNINGIGIRNMPMLRDQLQAMKDAAITPDQVKAVQDMSVAIREWGQAAAETNVAMQQLKSTIGNMAVQNLTQFWMDLTSAQMSAGDAALKMAQNFVTALLQMITEAIMMKIVFTALGMKMPAGSLASMFSNGGAVQKKATGGAIYGPGTGTSDSIPALLSNGEHVITAAEVRAAGGHDAIYRMRSAIRSGSRFAEGGAVGSVSGAALEASRFDASLGVELDDGLILRKLESPSTGKIIVKHLSSMQKAANNALGRG